MKKESLKGTQRAEQGKALWNAHFQKHPNSPHDMTAEDMHDIYKTTWKKEDSFSETVIVGFYIGFLCGYNARRLEDRTERKTAEK